MIRVSTERLRNFMLLLKYVFTVFFYAVNLNSKLLKYRRGSLDNNVSFICGDASDLVTDGYCFFFFIIIIIIVIKSHSRNLFGKPRERNLIRGASCHRVWTLSYRFVNSPCKHARNPLMETKTQLESIILKITFVFPARNMLRVFILSSNIRQYSSNTWQLYVRDIESLTTDKNLFALSIAQSGHPYGLFKFKQTQTKAVNSRLPHTTSYAPTHFRERKKNNTDLYPTRKLNCDKKPGFWHLLNSGGNPQ